MKARAVMSVLCAFAVGCSQAVDIPREQFEAASREQADEYRINTRQGRTYVAQQYTVTDSTVNISALIPSETTDELVPTALSIPLEEVVTIQRIEQRSNVYLLAIAGVVLFVGAIALITGGDAFTD